MLDSATFTRPSSDGATTPMLFVAGTVFAVLAGLVVALQFYALLPALFLPFSALFAVLLPSAETKQQKIQFVLGAALLFASLLWPRYSYIRLGGLPGLTPTRVVLAIATFVWIAYLLRNRSIRSELAQAISVNKALFISLFAYLLFRILSVAFAAQPFVALFSLINELTNLLLISLLNIAAFRSRPDIEKVLGILVLVTLAIGLIGVVEYIRQKSFFLEVFPITDDYAQEALLGKVRDSSYRIQSTFDNPLTYAQFLVCTQPLLLAAFFRQESKTKRLVTLVTLLISFGSAVATGSRSAMVVGLASFVLMLFLYFASEFRKRRIKPELIVLSLFALAATVLSGLLFFDHIATLIAGRSASEASSTEMRMLMLSRAIPLVLDSPVLGHGVGQAAALIGIYSSRGTPTVDSLLISLIVESGVGALLAYVTLILSAAFAAVRTAGNVSAKEAVVGLALATSLIAFFATSITLSMRSNFFFLSFLLSAVIACNQTRTSR